MKKTIICLISLFLLAGQGALGAAEANSAPAPQAPESYQLSVRDLVSFSVLNEPETETEQRIDGQGRIRVPYIGTVNVAGMTVREAEALIEETYMDNEIYITPQTMVRVVEYAVSEVSVLGQVNQPGKITLPIEARGLDIREAISQVGGFTNIARSREVIVTRRTGGKKETFKVNVDRMLSRKRSDDSAAFLVQAGDVIFVPERFF